MIRHFWKAVWECLPCLLIGLTEIDPPIVCDSVCMSDLPILYSCICEWSANSGKLSESDCHLCLVVLVKVIWHLCAAMSVWVIRQFSTVVYLWMIGQFWTPVWECYPFLFGGLSESDLPILCDCVCMSDPPPLDSCLRVFAISVLWFKWNWSTNCVR